MFGIIQRNILKVCPLLNVWEVHINIPLTSSLYQLIMYNVSIIKCAIKYVHVIKFHLYYHLEKRSHEVITIEARWLNVRAVVS